MVMKLVQVQRKQDNGFKLGEIPQTNLADPNFLCWSPSRDVHCTMSLIEMRSLFRLDDVVACAPQPITMLEASARSGTGLREVLAWLESVAK